MDTRKIHRGLNTEKTWGIRSLRQCQVPSCFREPFILTRYRSCRSSIGSCMVSAFHPTNETLNFWTHFVPFLFFFSDAMLLLVDTSFSSDPFNWPFLTFLLSACVYLLGSSMAHLFCSHSEVTFYVCFFTDYATVSIYIMGVSVAYNEYVFPSSIVNSFVHDIFLPVAFLSSVVFSVISIKTRLTKYRMLRVHGRKISFPVYFFWCHLPLFYRAFFGSVSPTPSSSSTASPADKYHLIHCSFAAMSGLAYGTHLPEAFAPGRFDLVGHSHQIFHLCNVGYTYYQYQAFLVEMTTRRDELVAACDLPTFGGTFGILLLSVGIHIVLILSIALWLLKPNQLIRIKHDQGIPTIPLKDH